jgi:uncharacterized protein (DUF983 family)
VADRSPAPRPIEVALRGVRPRCGKGALFRSFLAFAPRCAVCGLDFDAFNVGDGPAAFLTLGIGTIVTVLAVLVELAWNPPWWLHVLLWLPLTIVGVMVALRYTKALLLALEYHNAAREAGRKDQA